MLVLKEFHGLSLNDRVRDWCSCLSPCASPMLPCIPWSPFPIGVFKLNFDGSSLGNPGLAGFGCVLRDHLGQIRQVICARLGSVTPPKRRCMRW